MCSSWVFRDHAGVFAPFCSQERIRCRGFLAGYSLVLSLLSRTRQILLLQIMKGSLWEFLSIWTQSIHQFKLDPCAPLSVTAILRGIRPIRAAWPINPDVGDLLPPRPRFQDLIQPDIPCPVHQRLTLLRRLPWKWIRRERRCYNPFNQPAATGTKPTHAAVEKSRWSKPLCWSQPDQYFEAFVSFIWRRSHLLWSYQYWIEIFVETNIDQICYPSIFSQFLSVVTLWVWRSHLVLGWEGGYRDDCRLCPYI